MNEERERARCVMCKNVLTGQEISMFGHLCLPCIEAD